MRLGVGIDLVEVVEVIHPLALPGQASQRLRLAQPLEDAAARAAPTASACRRGGVREVAAAAKLGADERHELRRHFGRC